MIKRLTLEMIDAIVFGMENQKDSFYFDSETGTLFNAEELQEKPSRTMMEIPQWNPALGFQLMEKFVANLKHPISRNELRQALGQGKGVFRRFKNALKQFPEVEKVWFSFKEREMRKIVIDWFTRWAEAEGWEMLGPEPEDLDDLVNSDFELSIQAAEHWVIENDLHVFSDMVPQKPLAELLYPLCRPDLEILEDDILLILKGSDGEKASYLWLRQLDDTTYAILQLYSWPEYRGLGLSIRLMEAVEDYVKNRAGETLIFLVPLEHGKYENRLLEMGYARWALWYKKELSVIGTI
jgi:GNAT superfamily N-acetyltransferase